MNRKIGLLSFALIILILGILKIQSYQAEKKLEDEKAASVQTARDKVAGLEAEINSLASKNRDCLSHRDCMAVTPKSFLCAEPAWAFSNLTLNQADAQQLVNAHQIARVELDQAEGKPRQPCPKKGSRKAKCERAVCQLLD